MLCTRVVSALALASLASAAAAQQFTYNSVTPALPAQTIWTDGVAIVDVDADGDRDILFANGGNYATGSTAVQHLFLNDGTGSFTAGHTQLNVANFGARMVIAEDFDNDGDPDLLYAPDSVFPNPNKKPVLLLNDGTGNFSNVSGTNLPAVNMSSFCVVAGDVDNDGDLDAIFTDGATFGGSNAQAHLFLNDGNAVFTDVTATNMPVDLFKQQDAAVMDFDNDFDVDIAISGKGGAVHVYLNDGAGTFSKINVGDSVGSGGTYEVDWGDLDSDGDFDAAVQSLSGFTEGWARNLGTASTMTETSFTGGPSQDDNEMACFDYDVDGDMDVFVGSLATSERFYNNVNGVFTLANGVIQAVNDSSLDVAIGDLNNDGRYDVVTAQGESGNFTDKVYMNSGAVDTLAPVYLDVETPAAIGASSTVFRVQLEDQYADDSHIPVLVDYSWTTIGAGNGSDSARPMGNGLFRAEVPTAGATSVSLTWTATDDAGNVSVNGPITVIGSPSPWTDLGRALAGVSGNPSLVGNGTLVAGSSGSIDLTNAAPSAAALLFVSLSSSPVPFKGGSLCAFPFLATIPVATNGSGALSLGWPSWPSGLSGQSVFFQHAIADGAAIHGVALSNAIQGDVP